MAGRATAPAAVGDNAEVFSFEVGQLKRYLATRATAPPAPGITKTFQFSDQLADGAVDKYNQFRDNFLVELHSVSQEKILLGTETIDSYFSASNLCLIEDGTPVIPEMSPLKTVLGSKS